MFKEPLSMLPPNLRELKLFATDITDISLFDIKSSCRFLDILKLDFCHNDEITQINFPHLRKLVIYTFYSSHPVLIEDARSLELLILNKLFIEWTPLKVINAPRLRKLGGVSANAKILQFGETRFQQDLPIKLSTRVHGLKTLEIVVELHDDHQAKVLAGFLRCFPCLETLVVSNEVYGEQIWVYDKDRKKTTPEYWEQEGSFDCLDNHLKSVKIKGFVGEHHDLSFVKFLVQNAQVLKMISLLYGRLHMRKGRREIELRELILENKASLDVQLIFTENRESLFD